MTDREFLCRLRDALTSVLEAPVVPPPPPPPPAPLVTVSWQEATWTLDANHEVLCNGAVPLGYARGSEYLVVNGGLYLKGLDGHWWQRNAAESSWIDRGTVQP